ncbi:MAG: hypothetical protein U0T36_08245 [Saprospiraceae bacterium]
MDGKMLLEQGLADATVQLHLMMEVFLKDSIPASNGSYQFTIILC